MRKTHGDVAQLGEHYVRNVGVVGSNPIISTMELQGLLVIRQPFFFSQTLRGRRAKYPTRPESAA